MAAPTVTQAGADRDRAAVVARACLRAAARLDVPHRTVGRIIGLSEASISRLAQGGYRLAPDSKPYELAVLFVRLFRSLDALVGGDEASARAWLRAENLALGARPIDLVARLSGLVDVIAYLDARRALV
jgi:hypothetical protein